MKKQLLALSLIATSGLVAQDNKNKNMSSEQSGYCNTCCCTPCCCKPCCVPKPKKCIECECYTPHYYDLQCDWGAFVTVDFLYWYARETNLAFALEIAGKSKDVEDDTSPVVFTPYHYQNLGTKWDPGFRVGLGWNSGCDGWDYYLHWTYMQNRKSSSESVPQNYTLAGPLGDDIFKPDQDQTALINQWINPGFSPVTPTNAGVLTFDRVRAKWKLDFNSIDLELGRKYWLSPCFTLRPYTGVRGAWTRTTFRTTSTRTDPLQGADVASLVMKDKFKDRVWGVGILGGLQPNFFFCQNFILFGNFDVALIWGEFEVKKTENYSDPDGITGQVINYNQSSKHNFFQMTPILDVAIGLRWEECWCCYRYRTALDIGWEHHVWFDQNHRNKLYDFVQDPVASTMQRQGLGFRTFDEATGNLCLGGLVIRLRVDF